MLKKARRKKSTSGKKLMNVRKKFISTFLKIVKRKMQSRKQNLFRHKFHIRKNLFQLKMRLNRKEKMLQIRSTDRISKEHFSKPPQGRGKSRKGQTAPFGERKPLMRSVKGCIEQPWQRQGWKQIRMRIYYRKGDGRDG